MQVPGPCVGCFGAILREGFGPKAPERTNQRLPAKSKPQSDASRPRRPSCPLIGMIPRQNAPLSFCYKTGCEFGGQNHDVASVAYHGRVNESAGHYFRSPSDQERRRTISVTLADRTVDVVTANGIFSPEGLDKGTAALLSVVPAPPERGQFLDIGCGWGPLALTLAIQSPNAQVTAVEVNDRAAQLCRDNAAALGLTGIEVSAPDEVDPERSYDLIWSNPPIRIGKKALHDLLELWLPRLRGGGEAWLVVQKNLGADSLMPWIQGMLDERSVASKSRFIVERADTVKGFRILRVRREESS